MKKVLNPTPSIFKRAMVIIFTISAGFIFLSSTVIQAATTITTTSDNVDWSDSNIWIGVFISSMAGVIVRFWTENTMDPSFDVGIAYAVTTVAMFIIGAIVACLIFPYLEVRLLLFLAYLLGWGIVSTLISSMLYGKRTEK